MITNRQSKVHEAIAQELPGLHFDIAEDTGLDVVDFRLERRVDGLTARLSYYSIMFNDDAMESALGDMVRQLRRKAIADYGLEREIEARIKAAVWQERKDAAARMAQYLNRFRQQITVLDADGGHEFVSGDLPWWANAILNQMENSK